jgi:hypothetical protein
MGNNQILADAWNNFFRITENQLGSNQNNSKYTLNAMHNIDLSIFKKLSLLMGIASIGIACLVILGTYMDVSENSWQEQGTARATLMGLSIVVIFMIYGFLCFRSFKAPTVKNISIIYGVQSVVFLILMVLAWVAVFFLPTY